MFSGAYLEYLLFGYGIDNYSNNSFYLRMMYGVLGEDVQRGCLVNQNSHLLPASLLRGCQNMGISIEMIMFSSNSLGLLLAEKGG